MPKPKRSALYFYAVEYQHRQRSRGQRLTIAEAISACYEDWKALSEEDKQSYKQQFDDWRIQSRSNPQASSTATASTRPAVHDRDIPCEQFRQHYDRFALERNFLACEYLPLDKSELLAMPIYILNFQIFCQVDEEDGGQFIPAEMCVLRYTLNDGVTDYTHRFIKPDAIPTGYTSSCLEHAKETHEIPLKDFGLATHDYRSIYQQLKSFLTPTAINQPTAHLTNDDRAQRRYLRSSRPCVFFPSYEYQQTSELLDWLQEKAEGRKPTNETRLAHFASVESLIMVLAELAKQRASRDDIRWTFENATYSFLIEQRCPYHSHMGNPHCSVTRCHAAAKLISAYLNQLYVPDKPPASPEKSSPSTPMSDAGSSPMDRSKNTPTRRRLSTRLMTMPAPKPSNRSDSLASSSQVSVEQSIHQHPPPNAKPPSPFLNDPYSSNTAHHDFQRHALAQRRQILLHALESIEQQIEQLNVE